ncbi:MAG TPA: hypothetical protein VEI50_00135 [Nitrospiraceae bacterium]|nr:hypothetical protein [Nitrospiraceae bacterium]
MKDQKRAAAIQDSIRQILYHEWDSIRVSGAAPEYEYDSYIAPVYRVLVGSRSGQELIELLLHIERDTIGVSGGSMTSLQPIARKLLELDVSL